jgi:hypothetical protein
MLHVAKSYGQESEISQNILFSAITFDQINHFRNFLQYYLIEKYSIYKIIQKIN